MSTTARAGVPVEQDGTENACSFFVRLQEISFIFYPDLLPPLLTLSTCHGSRTRYLLSKSIRTVERLKESFILNPKQAPGRLERLAFAFMPSLLSKEVRDMIVLTASRICKNFSPDKAEGYL